MLQLIAIKKCGGSAVEDMNGKQQLSTEIKVADVHNVHVKNKKTSNKSSHSISYGYFFFALPVVTKTSVYGIIKIEKHTSPRRKYNGSSDP